MKFRSSMVRFLVLVILAMGAIMAAAPLFWMARTSLMNRDATETFPPRIVPMDPKKAEVAGREYYVYRIPIDGEIRELALYQKKGPIGIFVHPDNPDERYEARVSEGERIFQVAIHLENYIRILQPRPGLASFSTYLLNSSIFVTANVFGTVISSLFVAYGFARFRAKGLGILFLLLLSTIMLPGAVTLIPQFLVFKEIGWFDTLLPLIIPAYFGNPWHVFWLRQYFMTLPLELDDAARIDGCGPLGILWHVILPQSRPALATVSIFQGIWAWNEFFLPLIYLNNEESWTASVAMRTFNSAYGGSRDQPGLMAAATIMVAPVIAIFFLAQRLFIQGTVITGIKG